MIKLTTLPIKLMLMMSVLLCLVVAQTPLAYALSPEQKRIFDSGIYYFNADSSTTICGSINLIGSKNAEIIFNFFLAKGLSPPQAAGVFGNIMHESSGDPENIQNPAGRSKNPSDADPGGWGLIQWTPGSKITSLAQQAGVTSPIYELGTQLELVWQHMNNNPVVTQEFDLNYYKTLNDYKAATAYFEDKIEGAGVVALENRQDLAFSGLKKYGSNSVSGASTEDIVCETSSTGEVVAGYSLPVAKKWYAENPDIFNAPHHDYPALDISLPVGTPVYAIATGRVITAPTSGNCGVGLVVDVGDGVKITYCHGSDGGVVMGAKQGDEVIAGQLIMHSANTGVSQGPHLHVQFEVNGRLVCPQSFLSDLATGKLKDIKSLSSRGCTT